MIGSDIRLAASNLKLGLTVGIPTETVYGLAANALNEDAVISIFKIKNRPFFDPLIMHVRDIEQAKEYVKDFPETAQKLAIKYWPGPLTLLLKKNDKVPDIVTSGSEFVAIRVPNHPITLKLLEAIDFPLAAPSANPFGYISPTRAEHVEKQLGNKVSYILDGGISSVGLESTILKVSDKDISIARLGGLSKEEIEEFLGKEIGMQLHLNSNPQAPGQLDKHYSPENRFILSDNLELSINAHKGKKIALLTFGDKHFDETIFQLNLSKSGDLHEAARNLFHYMRLLDISGAEIILSEEVPNFDLGLAINDRLRRAASK